ncbi:DUF4189 domain-containing protein [Salaquimonas pukyongi]|uniref:DUF4189 domain-containing protein n=1 Tax=Salaquimonas pukyongi TaxID=2712698 RepID=UPI00096BAEC4|nr:DUF4189 domain-containing protein [Salaquimonas pukyongi]
MGRPVSKGAKHETATAWRGGLFILCLVALAGANTAHAADNYICQAGSGDSPLAIILDEQQGKGSFSGLGLKIDMTKAESNRWVNAEASVTFLPADQPPLAIVGFRQFACIKAAADPATAKQGGTAVERPGMSLGGNMRVGPGINHARMKPLRRGTRLMILSNARTSYRGYNWFRIKLTDGRTGFQWGGIICSEGTKVEGLKRVCRNAAKVGSGSDVIYQAYAIGPKGRYGHGSAPVREAAEAAALGYCGTAQCNVQNVTTRKCHALAHAGEVAFFGASKNSDRASSSAFKACKKSGAKNCQVTYVRCR